MIYDAIKQIELPLEVWSILYELRDGNRTIEKEVIGTCLTYEQAIKYVHNRHIMNVQIRTGNYTFKSEFRRGKRKVTGRTYEIRDKKTTLIETYKIYRNLLREF